MIKMGKDVSICENVQLDPTGELIIGNEVHISDEVVIYTHHHGESETWWVPAMDKTVSSTKLEIGNNVFIGKRAYVLSSCHKIGNKVTIGAMSVVTRDIPEGEIWAGNPAKKIGEYKL